jgi:periplasmic divalent cation tolerance protein
VDDSAIIGFLGGGFGEPPVRVADLERAAAQRRRVRAMHEIDACQVHVAVGDRQAALTLARTAVEEQLAACAQVGGPITSVYRWQGAIEEAEEWFVIFKSRLSRYQLLEDFIKEHHSYEVPEIICVPIAKGNTAYLEWIAESTALDIPSADASQ